MASDIPNSPLFQDHEHPFLFSALMAEAISGTLPPLAIAYNLDIWQISLWPPLPLSFFRTCTGERNRFPTPTSLLKQKQFSPQTHCSAEDRTNCFKQSEGGKKCETLGVCSRLHVSTATSEVSYDQVESIQPYSRMLQSLSPKSNNTWLHECWGWCLIATWISLSHL